MFDYNKIRNFLIVAESESVTESALRLHRTQSAISQQLQALESELGLNLLERRGGQMHLTREGAQLVRIAKPLFETLELGIRETQGRIDLVDGIIKIGSTPTICDHLLVPHLHLFQQHYPNIGIELVLQPDAVLESRLKDDEIDCAFIIEFKDRDFFDARPCFNFEETLVGTKKYLQQLEKNLGRKLSKFSDIEHARFIDFAQDVPNVRHWLKKNSQSFRKILEGCRPSVVVEDYESVRRFVEIGHGLAMIPKYMSKDALLANRLVEVFPQSKPTLVGVDFATRKKKNRASTLNCFVEYFQQVPKVI
ncbi:MAG: LysR family transcriptional regulator [Proteobacteria bacterium]|nr:LysR family transcriptional regulator [Pseudomonadota bacterium]